MKETAMRRMDLNMIDDIVVLDDMHNDVMIR